MHLRHKTWTLNARFHKMSDDGHEIIYEPDEPDEDDIIEDAK